jgi:hypothetical protein
LDEPPPQERLLGLLSGYWISQALYVAARLGIADQLVKSPKSAGTLAQETGAHERSLYGLLRALASFGIFCEDDLQRFSLTPLAECLRSDVPGSQRMTILMMVGQFYHAWGGLFESIKTGESAFQARQGQPFFSYLANHDDEGRIFDAAMTELSDHKSIAMLGVYDFSDVSLLADIGGGNGSTLVRALQRYPTMRGILFDLPDVIARARANLHHEGLAERTRLISGSFFEQLPAGADAYLLRHIIHNWNDTRARTILRNAHQAMTAEARIMVVERIVPPGNSRSYSKLADLNMLVLHGGMERTEAEFRALFAASGLRITRIVPTDADVSVIEAMRA